MALFEALSVTRSTQSCVVLSTTYEYKVWSSLWALLAFASRMTISYTPEAIGDLSRLRKFIAEKNPNAAQRIAGELLEGISKLDTFPRMGLPVSKAPGRKLIRDLFVTS